eukprot:175475_1
MMLFKPFCTICIWISLANAQIFVGRNGYDHVSCGTRTNPCGTLFMASKILNETSTERHDIYVIDGQNETQIETYLASQTITTYDPCLPIPFESYYHIEITFDETIMDLRTWYPLHLCQNHSRDYSNEYMFDGGAALTINNLIINDYVISDWNDSYSFIRDISHTNASVTCNHCVFKNITSSVVGPWPGKHQLIHSMAVVDLYDCLFSDIHTEGEIIFADHVYFGRADRGDSVRIITFDQTWFHNIYTNRSIVEIQFSALDSSNPLQIEIIWCDFWNIHAHLDSGGIIVDYAAASHVNIRNTHFDVVSGSIYESWHNSISHINVSNVSITAEQVTPAEMFLFHFTTSDIAYLTNINFLYFYNTNESCSYWDWDWNDVINVSFVDRTCRNPIKAIQNNGDVSIVNMTVDMVVIPETNVTYSGELNRFRYDSGHDFITNEGIMSITSVDVKRLLCYNFIGNSNILSVKSLVVTPNHVHYDANALHSDTIIYQTDVAAETVINQCNFYGGISQISAENSHQLEVYNSTFQSAKRALFIDSLQHMTFANCTTKNIGRYFSQVYSEFELNYFGNEPLQFWGTDNIVISDNVIHGYDPDGLILFLDNRNAITIGNEFHIDSTNQLYRVIDQIIAVNHSGVINLLNNDNSAFIHNAFSGIITDDYIDHDTPWIKYVQNTGTHCLSANTFLNFAIDSFRTNLTSCFRPDLIDCARYTFNECFHHMYEYMNVNQSLLDQTGQFMIDSATTVILTEEANIAMDNMEMTVAKNSNPDSIHFVATDGFILLIDSYVGAAFDILYNADANLISNRRLSYDTQYISHLLIRDQNTSSVDELTAISETQLVDHLSPVKINLTTLSTTYYPGQTVAFKYNILDKHSNSIAYNSSASIVVRLVGGSFSEDVTIISDGTCVVCEAGLVLNSIDIQHNLATTFTVDVSVENDALYPINNQLSFDVIGCPIGYGADPNNLTCIECAIGYYNLLPNNLNKCNSCDPESNKGIDCIGGDIIISEDHWLGFDGDGLVSSVCPPHVCCQLQEGCDYMDDNSNSLCALNRDPNSILCGKCKDGFSESVNSAQCVQCEQSYFLYLLYPIGLSLLILSLIIVTNLDPITPPVEVNVNYVTLAIKTLVLKNILYYQQAVSQTLVPSTMRVWLSYVSDIFMLNTTLSSDQDTNADPWCFSDGLNAKEKILLDLIVPITIFIATAILYALEIFACDGVFKIKQKKVNFAKVIVSSFLVIIGNILSVLFKMINCATIGDKNVHFYFGYEECYRDTYFLSLLSLMIICIAFGFIFVRIWKMDESQREKPNPFDSILEKYKPELFYWELVLFWRRIVIAFFAVSVPGIPAKCAFIGIMFIFLLLQHKYEPFVAKEANGMEMKLLCCFIFVIVTQLPSSKYPIFMNVVISLLIILPFVFMAYYGYHMFIKSQLKSLNEALFPENTSANLDANSVFDVGDIEIIEVAKPTTQSAQIENENEQVAPVSTQVNENENSNDSLSKSDVP